MDNNELKKHAAHIRMNIIKEVSTAQSGHPGGSLGCTDILTELYFEAMDINKDNADSIDRDRFVLSKGHAPRLLCRTGGKGYYPGRTAADVPCN